MAVGPDTFVTDKVRLIRLMREGSMGQVWLARHETLHTDVVVKFISEDLLVTRPDARSRFEREASTTARIKSPHVIQIFDYGEMEDGTPYMVMELLEGESLGDRIDRMGQLSAEETAEMLRQVGNALDLAHGNGIIHRDVKPQNINLRHVHGALHIKVLDFGIAKQTLDEDAGLTMPGMVVGTLEYLSREMVSGQGKVDYRLDLWALAIVAYKSLTGKVPFTGDGMVQVVKAIREGKFRRPSAVRPELPADIDNWFIRAFHPDEQKRFTSAAQMARAFKAVLEESAEAAAAAAAPAPRTTAQVPSWLWAVGGVAIVVVSGVIVAVAISSAGPPAPPSADPGESHPTTTASPPAPSASTPAATVEPSANPAAIGTMVQIPAGSFWMGCQDEADSECGANARPGRTVTLHAFDIDRTEVTTAAYGKCVAAGACTDQQLNNIQRQGGTYVFSRYCNWGQADRSDHPINCVSYEQATAYCLWVHKRLPTEAEWETAARGKQGLAFPWGNEPPSCERTVMQEQQRGCGRRSTWPVGSRPKDLSPYGLLDTAGNVREWVSDWYEQNYYGAAPAENPRGPEQGLLRVVRGGSWSDALPEKLRTTSRAAYLPSARASFLGFRCARDAH